MAIWTAKKFKLPNMNFEATAIRFDDGRVGLCYHGRTIWQEKEGGWDESAGEDWQTIWKNGRVCTFDELPRDMRLTCPKCGHAVKPDVEECLHCGVILSKVLPEDRLEESSAGEPSAEEIVKGRHSRILDAVLMVIALIIVGGIVYNLTRPDLEEKPPEVASAPVDKAAPPEQPRSEYDYSRPEPPVFQEEKLVTAEMPARDEPVAVRRPDPPAPVREANDGDFYSHIDLNDQAAAQAALQAEIKKLEQERRHLEEEQERPLTMAENQALRERMIQYNSRRIALQELIEAYKARHESP